MNLNEAGIFLCLEILTYGEDIIKSTEFERTFFEFDTIEQCVNYGDTSEFIQNTVRNNPGKDWLFALCLDPKTAGRGYILPVYNTTQENPSGKTPYEIQKIILDFEYVMTESVIPEVLGIPRHMIPPKTAKFKSWKFD